MFFDIAIKKSKIKWRENFLFLPKEVEATFLGIAAQQMRSNGIVDNDPHGMSAHVLEVLKIFKSFFENGFMIQGVDPRLLQISIIFHDVGRGLEENSDYEQFGGNHAFISEFLFRNYNINISPEEKDLIAYAIRYHNQGLRSRGIEKAESPQDILAQSLVFFDCCDGLRVGRVKDWCNKKGIPDWDDTPVEKIIEYYFSGKKIPETVKNDSLILMLIFNLNLLAEGEEVISPIRHRMCGDFIVLQGLKKDIRKTIEEMIG